MFLVTTGTQTSYDRSPATGTVDWSDDGVTWTTSFAFSLYGWILSQTRILPEAAPAAGYHRFWRVFCTNNNGGSSFTELGEIEFRATSGGPDQTTNLGSNSNSTLGRIVGSQIDQFNGEGYRAFNNDGSTSYWFASGTTNQWVGYIFTSPVTVHEALITAPGQITRGGKDMKIEHSDDGVTWTTDATFTKVWASTSDTVTVSVP
ncbi:MAG: hypothetical protein ACM3W4_03845 [Ignavibacteriales bacterium]